MSVGRSWDDLCDEMEGIKARPVRSDRKVFKAVFRDVTMIVTEFVTDETTGFLVTFQNANGEEFGEADTTPRALEAAKLVACRRAVEYVGGEYVSAESIIRT